MTTETPFRIERPDTLLGTLEIKLTPEQHAYLQENREIPRTFLSKKFNLKFSTPYSKIQITRALEVMNEPKVKKTGIRNPRSHRNVYYRKRQKLWEARIMVNKKRILIYRGSEEMAIKKVSEFKNNRGIR